MLRLIYITTALSLIGLVGCSVRESIRFHVDEDLVLETRIKSEDSPSAESRSILLERPVVVRNPGLALVFEFPQAVGKISLAAADHGSTKLEEVLSGDFVATAGDTASTGNPVFSVPLDPGTTFDSITLSRSTGGGEAGEILPAYIGLGKAADGVFFGPTSILDTRISAAKVAGNPHAAAVYDISRITDAVSGIAKIGVSYSYTPDQANPARVDITAHDGGNSARFRVRLRDGGATVYLYEGMCGFQPATIEIATEGKGFSLVSLTIDEVSRVDGPGMVPLPIDMGGVIPYAKDQWRNGDFELFSWNLRPEILIFDTASYAIQSEFFKRLAFFVEKAGSAGSLLPDRLISTEHGWNAHDYRSEDLARFFTRAEVEDFTLGERELLLRAILVHRGIIREDGGTWIAGAGGLISLSQESTPRLRELFLAHEGYHGVFFTDAQYRDQCASVWHALSPIEKQFWREFLKLRDYNTDDEFLVINEFQAYLMQVTQENLEAYYWDYSVPALVEAVPRVSGLVDILKAQYPDTFQRSALSLETFLKREAGIGAADLFCLQKVSKGEG